MNKITLHFSNQTGQTTGQRFLLCAGPEFQPGLPCAWSDAPLALRPGHVLRGEREEHRVLGRLWCPGQARVLDQAQMLDQARVLDQAQMPGQACWLLETLVPAPAGLDGTRALTLSRGGFALAWITLSDKGAAGQRADASGPLVEELVRGAMPLSLARGFVLPDEERGIRALISQLALLDGFDFICSTGGTGVAERDVTPEATLAVIEKRLPGFERAMTLASLAKTPHGAVSRAVCGTLGGAVIVNLPGSPKAVRECLGALLPALAHTIGKLQGDPSDCATV